MTTKEIAEATGKDERTVQRWFKKLADKMPTVRDKMSSVSYKTNGAEWALDETIAAIEQGMGKNAASLFKENASRQTPAPSDVVTRADLVEFGKAIVGEMIQQFLPFLNPTVQIRASLPAPKPPTLRNELNQLIRHGTVGNEAAARWSELYTAFYYRNHINLRVKAKNADMDKLDFAEQKNLLPELLSLAYELFPED